MEKITPFDIPLLNNEICQYLSLKDLARCVQVSKAWYDWFSPALWRDLDCHIRLPYVYLDTFARHQEHVRTMRNMTMKQAGSVFAQVRCTNLQRLEFMQDEEYKDVRRSQLPVLRSLEKMPTLRHLQIVLALDHDNTYKYWIRALEAMPHLESLGLKFEESVDGWVIQRMLHLCHGLQCLSVGLMGYQRGVQAKGLREYKDAKATVETMPEMQLRELSFDQSKFWWEENIFQALLERCPRLERLSLGWTRDGMLFQHLVKTLKENKLSALRHLRMAMPYTDLADPHIEVLSHISCGLESFDCDCNSLVRDDDNPVVQTLIKYHSHSLTRLDLHESRLPFEKFVNLMVGLPCLQNFAAMTIDGTSDGSNGILLNRHWECLGLRSLQLGLRALFYYYAPRDGWMESAEKRALDYLLSEVAKLTSLRELRIRCNSIDLYNKSRGYLEQLAGLKQLKILGINSTEHNTLGKHEAQWMADNWPKLLQVYEHDAPAVFKENLLKGRPLVEFVEVRSNH
ncbi:MAG: hypothetical protein J3Q66DRAFT_330929 [Benniella sp.]|nr:MAG: hypothetical protein J3Q66DRAFT_330929 [Benniella sp.]